MQIVSRPPLHISISSDFARKVDAYFGQTVGDALWTERDALGRLLRMSAPMVTTGSFGPADGFELLSDAATEAQSVASARRAAAVIIKIDDRYVPFQVAHNLLAPRRSETEQMVARFRDPAAKVAIDGQGTILATAAR